MPDMRLVSRVSILVWIFAGLLAGIIVTIGSESILGSSFFSFGPDDRQIDRMKRQAEFYDFCKENIIRISSAERTIRIATDLIALENMKRLKTNTPLIVAEYENGKLQLWLSGTSDQIPHTSFYCGDGWRYDPMGDSPQNH